MFFNRHWRLRGAVPLVGKNKTSESVDGVRKNKMKNDKKYIYIYMVHFKKWNSWHVNRSTLYIPIYRMCTLNLHYIYISTIYYEYRCRCTVLRRTFDTWWAPRVPLGSGRWSIRPSITRKLKCHWPCGCDAAMRSDLPVYIYYDTLGYIYLYIYLYI